MPADLDPVTVLARTDPADAHPVPGRPSLDELVARPVSPAAPGHRRSRAVVLAAAAVLVVVLVGAAIVVATGSDESAPPVTEPPTTASGPGPALLPLTTREPARDRLLALAARVESLDPTLGAGTVAYTRTVSFHQEAIRPDDPTSLVAGSTHLEVWTGPDFVVRTEQGDGPPPRDGEVVQMDADPPRPTDVETRPQARMDTILRDLPDDPAQLAARLSLGPGPSADPSTLLRVGTALGDEPRTGSDRAAVYRALADIEGVEYRGPVVDRAGREGIAFSTSHAGEEPEEAILVVDPATGVALGRESVSRERQPVLPFDGPTVQSSWTYLGAAYVAAPGDRPG